ncbi:MAG: GWxTD domain-containing protein [Gemmatimonas sp.]
MRHNAVPLRAYRAIAAMLVATCSVVLAGVTPLMAQSSAVRASTDSLVREALDKAANGDTASALDLLERATDQSPRDVDALYYRGLMLSRTTALSLVDAPRRFLAGYLLNRANDLDPRNPRYLIEMGRIRLKTPMRRIEAERMFRKALAVAVSNGDPVQLAEVAYELGTVKERRYLTGRDRWIYTTTNVIFDPIAARARLHYTREFLQSLGQPIENAGHVDRQEAEEYFRRALSAVPTHAQTAVALMGLLYDQHRYDEMRRIATPFAALDSAPPRVMLANGLAAYKLGQLAPANTMFERALAGFSPAERAELTHLGRITRKGDSVRIDGLNAEDRARTDSAFWEAADPMLSTPQNEARLEFLARMAYADLRFTDSDTRQVGWRTDRGLIIARYGEPPVIATFAPTSDADAKDAVGRVITVWYYPRTEVEFVFTGPPAMNVAFFAGNHRGFAEEQRQEAPFLLDNLTMALSVDTVPIQVARFRGDTPGKAQLMIAASIPTERLYAAAEIDRGALETSVRLGPPAALKLTRLDTMAVTLPTTRRRSRVWVDTVAAGANLRLRVEVRDAALMNAMGRAQSDLTMLITDTTKLSSSDMVVADRLPSPGTTVGRWNAIGLVPRGDLMLAQRDTFSVYWENYGLRPDADGRVKYEVRMIVTLEQIDRGPDGVRRFLGGISDIVGLSSEGDEQLGLRFERNEALGARDRVPELVTLGLGSAPAGRYRLELIITDRTSKQVTRTQRQFHLKAQ